jgi:hypothetical protein
MSTESGQTTFVKKKATKDEIAGEIIGFFGGNA